MSGAADIAVAGGGLVGASLAWGFVRLGAKVILIDAGEDRFHASAGNFGLVWVQGKGATCPDYADLSLRSAKAWQVFAEGVDDGGSSDAPLGYRNCGGVKIALGEDELSAMAAGLGRLWNQAEPTGNDTVSLDQNALSGMIPAVGPEATGGTFCPHDGHADPLATLRALYLAQVRVMRTWGALRAMSPDGLPIYQTSVRHPGASLVTCHSGVTLATSHAGEVASAILEGRLNETYPAFSADRFAVAA